MPGPNMITDIFTSYHCLAAENEGYILQIGLNKSLASKDELNAKLTKQEYAALDAITELLASLKLIPSLNYTLFGHDMRIAVTHDKDNPKMTAYDGRNAIHIAIKLPANVSVTNMDKLAAKLEQMGLLKREHPYFRTETVRAKTSQESDTSSASWRGV